MRPPLRAYSAHYEFHSTAYSSIDMHSSGFLTLSFLSGLALAQNANNSTGNDTLCKNQQTLDQISTGTVNSTGSDAFTWNSSVAGSEPWYISITLNETVPDEPYTAAKRPITWSYLSVPGTTRNVSACIYQFEPRNATSTGNSSGNDVGCAGVLPEGCTSYLQEALLNQTSGGYQSDIRCGSIREGLSERGQAACGWLGDIGWRGKYYSFTALRLVSKDLSLTKLSDL